MQDAFLTRSVVGTRSGSSFFLLVVPRGEGDLLDEYEAGVGSVLAAVRGTPSLVDFSTQRIERGDQGLDAITRALRA